MKYAKTVTVQTGIIAGVILAAVFVCTQTVQGVQLMDLVGDNLDMNQQSSWEEFTDDDSTMALSAGYTGWLDSEYTLDHPNPAKWGSRTFHGHVEFRNGADYTLEVGNWALRASYTNPEQATLTIESGAVVDFPSIGLSIGYGENEGGIATFKGGTFTTDGIRVGMQYNDEESGFAAKNQVGTFKVVGSNGSISNNRGSRPVRIGSQGEVKFELDSNGDVTPIDVSGQNLGISREALDGALGGTLTADLSAVSPSQGSVTLFDNYAALVDDSYFGGEFGTVDILGYDLESGTGTDPMTYNVDYGSDSLSLSYNTVPEPGSLLLLGIAGLLLLKRRRV